MMTRHDNAPSSPSITPPFVLVVDDEASIREVLVDFLSMEGFDAVAVGEAKSALAILEKRRVDVLLLDMKLPGMNGLELLEQVRAFTPSPIPIMMTGFGTVETAVAAMKTGAYDYVLKPFKVRDVIRIIERGLEKRALETENIELRDAFKQTILGLANILEDKDPYTRGHSERVSRYARMIAEAMELEADEVERVADSALMHDIGKLGIRFEELNKAEPLTASEYEMFKSHTTRGKWLLKPIKFLHPLIPGVYHHHERWDGKGYPMGLKGEETPLMARILSVADTFDAMTSNRAYRRALPVDIALKEIEDCAGTQFDPRIVDVFLKAMTARKFTQHSKNTRWQSLIDATS
ncbi:MAG: HD-GYP domain-containing protein [Bradymonadaceae bacterium]